jgi:hypothetical protein
VTNVESKLLLKAMVSIHFGHMLTLSCPYNKSNDHSKPHKKYNNKEIKTIHRIKSSKVSIF